MVEGNIFLVKYEFAQLHLRELDWLVKQYIMRAKSAARYAKDAKRVLDIGCGSGYCAYHMARANPQAQVTAVDISADAVEYASSTYQAPNLNFEQGNAFNLNCPDNSFDLVVTYEALEHVDNGEEFIKELARLTSPNGVLICSTPNRKYDFPNEEHINLYLPEELFNMCRRFFGEVDQYYQFLSQQEYQKEWQKIHKKRFQNIVRLPLHTATFLTPTWLKQRIKKFIGIKPEDPAGRTFTIREEQNYTAEDVTRESEREGAYPYILVAVCRKPKVHKDNSPVLKID